MKQKYFLKNVILVVLISCVLNTILWIAFHGVPIMSMMKAEEVESITISYCDVQQKEIVEKEEIKLLVKARNLLNYKFFGKIEEKQQPSICVIYHLKNGSDVMLEANNTTVWENKKSHEIKQKEVFVNIVKGLFFDLAKE